MVFFKIPDKSVVDIAFPLICTLLGSLISVGMMMDHADLSKLLITGCTVLTATGQVNGRWKILTPHRIETHEPTATKFRTFDYVRERTP